VAAVLFLAGACWSRSLDPAERARQRATQSVREEAAQARRTVADLLGRSAPNPDTTALADTAKLAIEQTPGYRGTVFAATGQPNARVRLDVAFVAHAEAGGGGDFESATLRLCARIEGTAGHAASTVIRDTPCDPHLPTYEPGMGDITGKVKLSG
jgi:hypothetical protein